MALGPHIEFSEAWNAFIGAVRKLWQAERASQDRPHLQQYTNLSDEALALLADVGMGAAIQESFLKQLPDPRSAAPARLYLLELTAFAAAVDKHSPAAAANSQSRRDLLGDVSTIAGSAKDIFDDLPGWAKAGIHGFSEVAKLFKPR